MKLFKFITLLVVLLAIALQVTPVSAGHIITGHVTGGRVPAQVMEHMWNVQHSAGTHVIMQDLSQCVLSTDGTQVLCIDVCGGRSVPGSICSYE